MIFFLESNQYIDTSKGFDISIPLTNDDQNPLAWYVDKPVFEPVRAEGFVGLVSQGSSTNFRNIFFNPHGHGTHTECLGHITNEIHSINQHLKKSFFTAEVISITPEKVWNEQAKVWDEVITKKMLEKTIESDSVDAIVLRTSPNQIDKKNKNYSNSNPAYLNVECVEVLNQRNVSHFLIDLPSVDRENDEGKLLFHHAFWQVPENPQFHKTITEFIYVSDDIKDGKYILNLQTAPFENDATPSRPVLFEILEK
jgi:kynurenine formamidase